MKLVTQTEYAGIRLGEKRGVRLLCEAGYDGLDYSMFRMRGNPDFVLNTPGYKNHALALKEIADSYGVTFEQSHAPFPTAKDKDEKYNSEMLDTVKRSIEIASLVGAKVIIVHPVNFKKHKEEKNIELFRSLESTAEDFGVKIALENMWGRKKRKPQIIPSVCSDPDEFNRYIDILGNKNFTACLDIGHCGLVGIKADDFIRKMGSRITCLHIHDNNNKEDSHTLPYMMDLDWQSILKALADIYYSGNFTFEADNFIKSVPLDLLPDACRYMVATGRNMIKQIEDFKGNKND